MAIKFASDALRNDPSIMLNVVKQNHSFIQYAGESLQEKIKLINLQESPEEALTIIINLEHLNKITLNQKTTYKTIKL